MCSHITHTARQSLPRYGFACQLRQARGQTPQAPADPAVLCVHCLTPLRHGTSACISNTYQPEKKKTRQAHKSVPVGKVGCAAAYPPCRLPLPSLRLTFGQRTVLVPLRWRLTPKSSVRSPFACHCAGTLSLRATSACLNINVPSPINWQPSKERSKVVVGTGLRPFRL